LGGKGKIAFFWVLSVSALEEKKLGEKELSFEKKWNIQAKA